MHSKKNRYQVLEANQKKCEWLHHLVKPFCGEFNIKNISFVELRLSGHWTVLHSHPDYYLTSLKNGILETLPNRLLQAYPKPGIYLIDLHENAKKIIRDEINILSEFNLGHSLRVVTLENENEDTMLRVYGFEGAKDDNAINHAYINHLDLIQKLNRQLANQIKQLSNINFMPQLSTEESTLLQNYVKMINNNSESQKQNETLHCSNFSRSPISLQQKKVIDWYLKGRTASQTAVLMGISRRTVERHFEKMRLKFDCNSKFQIVHKLQELNII